MAKITWTCLAVLGIVATAAELGRSQTFSTDNVDLVQKGRRLAEIVCANCHVVARNQEFQPILRPPAPAFETIAQRAYVDADFIRLFLTTTHRDLKNPKGMPNPQLLDYQIEEVTAYLLSLRKQSALSEPQESGAQQDGCRATIARLDVALGQAQTNQNVIGTASESVGARLHHQPTPKTVEQAQNEAENNIESALAPARKLEAEGKDAECLATLKKVALPLGIR